MHIVQGRVSGIADAGDGVEIVGPGSAYNKVRGSYIGTDSSGLAAVPNGGNGVRIWGGTTNNSVGGLDFLHGNLISGNSQDGILIGDGDVFAENTQNEILSNIIGINCNGDAALSNRFGIYLRNGASETLIGGGPDGRRKCDRRKPERGDQYRRDGLG